jgi:O-antigen/teichoic acid export membrane protein
VPTSFGIVAWVSRAHSENSAQTNRALRKSVRVSFTIVALVAIAIYVSADQVVNLFGDAYHHSAQMVRMLLPGYVLMSVFHIIHFDFTGRRTPQLSTTAASAGLLATLGGNLLLIPVFGGLGAAASTSLGYIVTSCVILWLYIKREGAHGEPT